MLRTLMKTFLIALMILGMQVKAFGATVTINLEANLLKKASGDAMLTTGLVILVANTNGTSFSQPTAGAFVSGGNTIVATWDLSKGWDTAGVLGAVANFGLSDGLAAGNPLQLYWFPTLTIDSTAPGAGTPYGLYTDPVGITDSEGGEQSAPWVVPGGGNTVDFYFLTADANSDFDSPGRNPASAGLPIDTTTVATTDSGSLTWSGGCSYNWDINDAEGTAGFDPGWSSLSISGPLQVTASSDTPFTIHLFTLNGNLAEARPTSTTPTATGGPLRPPAAVSPVLTPPRRSRWTPAASRTPGWGREASASRPTAIPCTWSIHRTHQPPSAPWLRT